MSQDVTKFTLNDLKQIKASQNSAQTPRPTCNDSLPDWFQNPTKITDSKPVKLKKFPLLTENLLQALRKNKITHLFPVQSHVLPYLLAPRNQYFYINSLKLPDICVCSPTGSGKTLVFSLPIIQALEKRVNIAIRAIILAPVTDLAIQIFNVFKEYSSQTTLSIVLLGSGSVSFAKEQKRIVDSDLTPLADVLISTPGRLVDHIKYTKGFDLSNLRFLVIDEADRMLRDNKHQWVMRTLVPENCQKLLFSATLTHDPDKLLSINLHKPKLFTSAEGGGFIKPKGLREYYVLIDENVRPLVVVHMMLNLNYDKVLCFVNSILSANRLYHVMEEYGLSDVAVLTSRCPPAKRASILNKFNSGQLRMVICSDMITRGIDFGSVEYVVSYDYSKHIKTYVHRVGRTARAGLVGTSFVLLNRTQLRRFKGQIRSCGGGKNIKEMKIDKYDIQLLNEGFEQTLRNISNKLKNLRNDF